MKTEIEIYAAGLRDPQKMMALALELDVIEGLHYKVDTRHDLVYMEFSGPVLNVTEMRDIFERIGLKEKFIGQMPLACGCEEEE